MEGIATLPHFHTGAEVANLVHVDPDIIERYIRSKIHPLYVWKRRWKQPRFSAETIPEWLNLLDTVPLDSLPQNPPPLERPAEVFEDKRRGPTSAELKIAARICGIK